MSWILLTNDDGIDAPGLLTFAATLSTVAPVRVVVPDGERSWVGKAITRYEPLRVERRSSTGPEVYAVSGYPADCVQLGVHALFDDAPDLVVTGINIGYNHGSAYLQSSGTVGAAIEATLAGVPGLAFSAGVTSRPWDEWKQWVWTDDAATMWKRLAGVACDIVSAVFAAAPEPDTVISVNMPDDADRSTERRLTSVASVGYDRLFARRRDGTYVHDFGGGLRSGTSLVGTDVEAAADGVIAITPLRPIHEAEAPPWLEKVLR